MTEGNIKFKKQNIIMEDRSKVTVTGVEQVESFNDNTIVLRTIKGGMVIKGEDLNIGNLNLEDGNVKISGTINGIDYVNETSSQKGNIIGKIFK